MTIARVVRFGLAFDKYGGERFYFGTYTNEDDVRAVVQTTFARDRAGPNVLRSAWMFQNVSFKNVPPSKKTTTTPQVSFFEHLGENKT